MLRWMLRWLVGVFTYIVTLNDYSRGEISGGAVMLPT